MKATACATASDVRSCTSTWLAAASAATAFSTAAAACSAAACAAACAACVACKSCCAWSTAATDCADWLLAAPSVDMDSVTAALLRAAAFVAACAAIWFVAMAAVCASALALLAASSMAAMLEAAVASALALFVAATLAASAAWAVSVVLIATCMACVASVIALAAICARVVLFGSAAAAATAAAASAIAASAASWAIVAFMFFYRFAEAMVNKAVPLFLKDPLTGGGLAFDNSQIGLVKGTIGMIGIICGGIVGGILVSKIGLKKGFWSIAILMHLPITLYLLAAIMKPTSMLVISVIEFADQFGYGLGYAGYSVYLMRVAQRGNYPTAHYAIGTGIGGSIIAVAGILSGVLVVNFGYVTTFALALLFGIP